MAVIVPSAEGVVDALVGVDGVIRAAGINDQRLAIVEKSFDLFVGRRRLG